MHEEEGEYDTQPRVLTRQHSRLMNLMGVKQIVCGCNKMDCDTAGYQIAKTKGVPEDYIIWMAYDDIASSSSNPCTLSSTVSTSTCPTSMSSSWPSSLSTTADQPVSSLSMNSTLLCPAQPRSLADSVWHP